MSKISSNFKFIILGLIFLILIINIFTNYSIFGFKLTVNDVSNELVSQNLLKLHIEQINKIIDLYNSIYQSEFKKTSQNGEDGVIEALLKFLNITNSGYYVELGTENGNECNTRFSFCI